MSCRRQGKRKYSFPGLRCDLRCHAVMVLSGPPLIRPNFLPAAAISERVTRRVDEQFERGLLDEIRTLLARGIPESARPFGGLVYRQALEHLRGARDEPSTRALIAQENRRYARRQLIWFRKEPNLSWFDGPGESAATIAAVTRLVDTYVARP